MKHTTISTLVGMFLFAIGSPANAANSISSSTNSQSIDDTIGYFAAEGVIGSKAGEKSISEANAYCILQSSDGGQERESDDDDFYETFKDCMKDFVPFSQSGDGSEGSCLTETVSWGECSASVSAGASGVTRVVSNSSLDGEYEGTGEFRCSNTVWQFTGGGCRRDPVDCDAGALETWAVTSPTWADESSSTVYYDRYGVERSTPKSRCVARMPSADSGQLVIATISLSEMANPSQYDSSSTTPKRCFDGDWIDQPDEGSSDCPYTPKSCSAQTYSHDGCGFTIPALEHDTVYVDSTPTPLNSTGAVEAYCWDGEVEIKNQSCELSCDATVVSNTWRGALADSEPKSCAHADFTQSSNIGSGGIVIIDNEVEGMTGTAGYRCDNGTWTETSNSCEQQGCTILNASTWGGENGTSCSHSAKTGTWEHGETYSIDSETDFLTATGTSYYKCLYGGLTNDSDGSLDLDPDKTRTCADSGEVSICISEEAATESDTYSYDADLCPLTGYEYDNGMCCYVLETTGTTRCINLP